MKSSKVLVVMLLLLSLVGCTVNNNDEALKKLSTENEALKQKLDDMETTLKSYEKQGSFTFKDEVISTFKIVDKIVGMDDKNMLVVSDKDQEHNSLMLIEITDSRLFESFELEKEYDMKVYYIFVVEPENQHSRIEIIFSELIEK